MSDQSGTAEGQPNEAPEQSSGTGSESPEWLGPINTRMDELRDQNASIVERLEQFQQPEEGLEYEDDEDGEGGFTEDDFDEHGDYTAEGARKALAGVVDERLQGEFAKRDAVIALEQREDAFEALREEISELQDDKTAARLVRETAEWCARTGNEHIIDRPEFVELLEDRFVREQYQQRVNAERESEPEREVMLESAAGAGAPSGKKEPDWGERIVKAAERLRPQI
jgi:hypothetical protein